MSKHQKKKNRFEANIFGIAECYKDSIKGLEQCFWYSVEEYLNDTDAYRWFDLSKDQVLDEVLYAYHQMLLKGV